MQGLSLAYDISYNRLSMTVNFKFVWITPYVFLVNLLNIINFIIHIINALKNLFIEDSSEPFSSSLSILT